jgi:hypothetical protein
MAAEGSLRGFLQGRAANWDFFRMDLELLSVCIGEVLCV